MLSRFFVDSIVVNITLAQLNLLEKYYEVQMIKKKALHPSKEQKDLYYAVTGRSYERIKRASAVYIIHHHNGQSFVAMEYRSSGEYYLGAHGLRQYEKDGYTLQKGSIERQNGFLQMLEKLGTFAIHSVDYAMDQAKIPKKIIDHLRTKRPEHFVDTTVYFQSKSIPSKTRKKEQNLKILIYDKQKQSSLLVPMQRLEFSIGASYWKKVGVIRFEQLKLVIKQRGEKLIPL